MRPGTVYTADDGSTVVLQLFAEEGFHQIFNKGTPAEFHYRAPDRLTDIRLLEMDPNGERYVTRLRCRHIDPDTLDGPEIPMWETCAAESWQEPSNGIIGDRTFW